MYAVMDPSQVEAGLDLGTDLTDLISKIGQDWKSNTEFSLKTRIELRLASETLRPDLIDKSREI